MRFKDYIQESEGELSFDELIKMVKQRCKPFVKNLPDRPAIRGIIDTKGGFYPQTKNRKAANSAPWLVFLLNAGIEGALGVQDVRSRAVFCSGRPEVTAGYGDTYFFFPAGNFDCVWSTAISDPFTWDVKILRELANDIMDTTKYPGGGLLDVIETAFDQLAKRSTVEAFLAKDKQAMKLADDVFKKGYAMNEEPPMDNFGETLVDEEPPMDNFGETLVDAVKEFFKRHYTKGDFNRGIESGNEIMVYESAGYVIIPAYLVRQHFFPENGFSKYSSSFYEKAWAKLIEMLRPGSDGNSEKA